MNVSSCYPWLGTTRSDQVQNQLRATWNQLPRDWYPPFSLSPSIYRCIFLALSIFLPTTSLSTIALSFSQKRRQPKNSCRLGEFFLWFWAVFGNFTSFFATLQRFEPHNDGNQLPGCRLFFRYDIYTYTYACVCVYFLYIYFIYITYEFLVWSLSE